MTVQEALIRLRDDIKEWVTNNLNAIGKPKASDVSIDTIEGLSATDAQGAIKELILRSVDQTAGKTFSGSVLMLPVAHNTIQYCGYIPLPFIAKNANYTVDITYCMQGNVGEVSAWATGKSRFGFSIALNGDYAYQKCMLNTVEYTITFA